MARDGFVSFGSQGRGREAVTALLGEQRGSRSLMSHRLALGVQRSWAGLGLAGQRLQEAGQHPALTGGSVGMHEEEGLWVSCSFQPKML